MCIKYRNDISPKTCVRFDKLETADSQQNSSKTNTSVSNFRGTRAKQHLVSSEHCNSSFRVLLFFLHNSQLFRSHASSFVGDLCSANLSKLPREWSQTMPFSTISVLFMYVQKPISEILVRAECVANCERVILSE